MNLEHFRTYVKDTNGEYKPSPAEKGGTIHSLRELGVDEENRTNVR